jgi:hypothetical protein
MGIAKHRDTVNCKKFVETHRKAAVSRRCCVSHVSYVADVNSRKPSRAWKNTSAVIISNILEKDCRKTCQGISFKAPRFRQQILIQDLTFLRE